MDDAWRAQTHPVHITTKHINFQNTSVLVPAGACCFVLVSTDVRRHCDILTAARPYCFDPMRTVSSTMRKQAATVISIAATTALVGAHPLCVYGPDRAVSTTTEATFCPNEEPEGFCCELEEEAALAAVYSEITVSEACAPLHQEVGYTRNYSRWLIWCMRVFTSIMIFQMVGNSFRIVVAGKKIALRWTLPQVSLRVH